MKIINLKHLVLLIFISFISCNSEIKFEEKGWNEKADLNSYPNRQKMLNDLMKNHKIKGLKFSELKNLLGKPKIKNTSESITAFYNIETEYGNDIDPVYIKNLEISLNIDSVAQNYIVTNWRKN